MRAKQYLQQIKKLDLLVQNKLIEKQRWKEIALGTTPSMGGERVQSSGSQQKMADAVGRYVDLEREIDAAIDTLVDTKKEIVAVIETLNVTEYELLHKIYVQGQELQDAADDLGKSYSWVTTIHGKAMQSVQKILDKKEAE